MVTLVTERIPFLLPAVSSFTLPVVIPSTKRLSTHTDIETSSWIQAFLPNQEEVEQPQEDSNTNGNESMASLLKVEVASVSGLSKDEIPMLLQAISDGYANGLGVEIDTSKLKIGDDDDECANPIGAGVNGVLGRVLILYTNLDDDTVEMLHSLIAEQIDQRLYSDPPELRQPVLISIQNDLDAISATTPNSLIENEIQVYELIKPIGTDDNDDNSCGVVPSYRPPTLNVLIDGATTKDDFHQTKFTDTSSILVFDDLVNDSLRQRLLDVMLGNGDNKDKWDDADGPNPRRWVRGGLSDIPGEDDDEADIQGSCWGLPEECIEEICFQEHAAIIEFEEILARVIFPQFTVTRLPEAVFGASVSPLTANAPTCGDAFDYHIDGDPFLTPPSPWTDVFGRYPNRLKGKPRFMSCIVYLNEVWDDQNWGAPTKFLDPPTEEAYEVYPKPGRIVLSDQDCRHTVVAPNESAGKRPRYSLVWKLILHPKSLDQDMMDLADGREWPTPILVGSASEEPVS